MSKYVVLDLEMCAVPDTDETAAFPCRNELIQIGAVLLDETLEPVDTFMTLVAPQYGMIDAFIENLTGISAAEAAQGPAAADALAAFAAWLPEDAVLVSWSETDKEQLLAELTHRRLDIPRLARSFDTWVDSQQMFSVKMEASKVYRLSEALNIAGVDAADGEHDALIDARNTAKLFAKMMREPVLQLSPYYTAAAEEAQPATYNPFAALLAGFKVEE